MSVAIRALRPLVEAAVLAPSSHNTQPWVFRLGDDLVELHADRTRALPVNDPHDRELTMSCGAAWLNARVAAAHDGLGLETTVLPDGPDGDRLVVARPGGAAEQGLPPLATVAARRTVRRPFREERVAPARVEALVAAAVAEGATLVPLDDATRPAVAELVADGDRRQFDDPRWRRELAAWMHPRRAGDGLAVPGLAVPIARFVVSHVDVGRGTGRRDAELVEDSPLLAVLATAHDDPAAWLAAGQALERVLLVACAHDVQASYMNQPIQVGELRPRVADLLPDGLVPQIIIRLGHPDATPDPAPRRPVDDVVETT